MYACTVCMHIEGAGGGRELANNKPWAFLPLVTPLLPRHQYLLHPAMFEQSNTYRCEEWQAEAMGKLWGRYKENKRV